ncbi:unnamed protein product [Cyclocybe aegerita]|uniref:Enoyl reductase (ER) domain-containing protein n=1 Tax=Cyclocybe aegerita TaxID=1973307 RepID=A0A8S0X1V1_CYCAE|nr:unnamed protein product [Cyclocybe aegerita]
MVNMKALITAPQNTAVVADIPVPVPGPREIRVKVHSVALNPVDALYVAYPLDKPGRVVGSDFAGTVDRAGEEVTRWRIGDRVAGFVQGASSGNWRPGAFAQFAILEGDLAIKVPSRVSFEEAATLPLCSLTAAQALFIRLEINSPFPSPFRFDPPKLDTPAILVYSGATSVGLFAISLAKLLHTPAGHPYRIFATVSPRNREKLLDLGVEAAYDYYSSTWPEDLRRASGGISYAIDCISEDESTARISQAFVDGGGKIAVLRQSAWDKQCVREDVLPLYGAVWSGLGHEVFYNTLSIDDVLPASPSWRQFTIAFYHFLSTGAAADASKFPIPANPVRLMPGGLASIVSDGFALLGSGKVRDRQFTSQGVMMNPISAEKLVYNIDD